MGEQALDLSYVETSDALKILKGYHALGVPGLGEFVNFQPLAHIPAVDYVRWRPLQEAPTGPIEVCTAPPPHGRPCHAALEMARCRTPAAAAARQQR